MVGLVLSGSASATGAALYRILSGFSVPVEPGTENSKCRATRHFMKIFRLIIER
jgi:hypothetical protein